MRITHDQLEAKDSKGFTLTEILIAISILALVAGVVLPTSFFLIKSNVELGNATVMTTQGRQIVEQLGNDIRSTVSISKLGDRTLEIITEDPDEVQTKITYQYDQIGDVLTRKVGSGTARTILSDVTDLKFVYYNAQDTITTKLIDTKKVEVQMTMKMSVMGRIQSFEQKSTRFVMRNRATPTST